MSNTKISPENWKKKQERIDQVTANTLFWAAKNHLERLTKEAFFGFVILHFTCVIWEIFLSLVIIKDIKDNQLVVTNGVFEIIGTRQGLELTPL